MIHSQTMEIADELQGYWDDVRGGWLDPELAREGRKKEIQHVIKYGVFEIVPRQRMYDAGKTRPLDTRWSDTNKGTLDKPEVRC